MEIPISVIELKRDEWKRKRWKAIEEQLDLENAGDIEEAKALDRVIDTMQEAISDLSQMIDALNSLAVHEKNCFRIINNIKQ